MLSIENIKIKEEFRKPSDDLYILFGALDRTKDCLWFERGACEFLTNQYGLSYKEAQIVYSKWEEIK